MKINSVSINSNYQSISNTSKINNSKNVAFKRVWLGLLEREQIQGLFDDGPGLIRTLDRIIPVLEKKFGDFFSMRLNFNRDFFRHINMSMSCVDGDYAVKTKKYIVQNNEKVFKFPDFVIKSFKEGKDDYDYFLRDFYPLKLDYAEIGEQAACEEFYKFAENNDVNGIIKKMYESNPPVIKKKKSDYLIHDSNIYGNPAV